MTFARNIYAGNNRIAPPLLKINSSLSDITYFIYKAVIIRLFILNTVNEIPLTKNQQV